MMQIGNACCAASVMQSAYNVRGRPGDHCPSNSENGFLEKQCALFWECCPVDLEIAVPHPCLTSCEDGKSHSVCTYLSHTP